MTDEAYLRDLERAAAAVSPIPNDYRDLRSLLAALPDPTMPDVRPGRGAPTEGQTGVNTSNLTLTSPVPIGSAAGVDLGTVPAAFLGATSFPASPDSGDVFYRTDLGFWFQYDGAHWWSTPMLLTATAQQNAAYGGDTTGAARVFSPATMFGGTDLNIHKIVASVWTSNAQSGTLYWNLNFVRRRASDGGVDTIVTIDTKSQTVAQRWKAYSVPVSPALGDVGNVEVDLDQSAVGAGSMYFAAGILASVMAT